MNIDMDGEPVKAVVPGVLRRAAHPQPVADGAAAAALRLVFRAEAEQKRLEAAVEQSDVRALCVQCGI